MIVLPCPKRPDLDCIAGALAYAEYLTRVKQLSALPWICGEPDGEAQFYLNRFRDLPFATDADAKKAQAFILIDFSAKDPLPDYVDPKKVIQVIDHRLFTEPHVDFPNALIQIDEVGAAATQVTEYFIRDDITPSPAIAAMLYGAIYSHTLCLRSRTTTERDRDAATWLYQHVTDAEILVEQQLRARDYTVISQMPHILTTEMKMANSCLGRYGFSLIEMQHGLAFWQDYKNDIIAWAHANKFPTIVNIIDMSRNASIFHSSSTAYSDLLEARLSADTVDKAILIQPAMFRKEVIPLLQ